MLDAIIGPSHTPKLPAGMPGQLCMPYTASIGKRSNRPSSIMRRAPAPPSSAGWKIKYTVPSKSRCCATNVIPDEAKMVGTVRTFTTEVLDLIEHRMRLLAENIAAGFDAEVDFAFRRNYPPLVNHAKETRFAVEVMKAVAGADKVDDQIEPTMGAEDFAFFLQEKPGCYIFLGNGDGDHRDGGHGLGPCVLHNGSYDFNDNLLPIGASFWVRMAEMALPLAR